MLIHDTSILTHRWIAGSHSFWEHNSSSLLLLLLLITYIIIIASHETGGHELKLIALRNQYVSLSKIELKQINIIAFRLNWVSMVLTLH